MLENWIKIAVDEIFGKIGVKNKQYDLDLNGVVDDVEFLHGCVPEVSGGSVYKIPEDITHGDILIVNSTPILSKLSHGVSGSYLMTRGSNNDPIWSEIL